MREIKFRQWMRHGVFHYYGFLNAEEFCGPIPPLREALVKTEQFTGLRDKNGREIYEGDVVKRAFSVCEIEWCDGAYELVSVRDGRFVHRLCSLLPEDLEVIGNIHENPELLK